MKRVKELDAIRDIGDLMIAVTDGSLPLPSAGERAAAIRRVWVTATGPEAG